MIPLPNQEFCRYDQWVDEALSDSVCQLAFDIVKVFHSRLRDMNRSTDLR